MALLLSVLFGAVLLLAVLLFTVNSKVDLVFNSTDSDMHLTLFWLYPLLKSVVTRENDMLIARVYLLNKKILTRQINKRQSTANNKGFLKHLNPTDIRVDTQYGFRDPFITGLTFSAVTVASEFFRVESLNQRPDFLAADDYINFDATARLNLGHSLMKLI